MTRITFYKKNDDIVRIKCDGHSGYDVSGRDIACASVSVLVINTVNSIENLTSDKIGIKSDEKRGLIDISIPLDISDDTKLLIASLELGVSEISKAYSEYVKIDYKEV